MVNLMFLKWEHVDMVVKGTKTTTIRKQKDYWCDQFVKGRHVHIYYGSPRARDSQRVGKCKLVNVEVRHGRCFTDSIARADGFETREELWSILGAFHNMTVDEVKAREWAILTLGEWIDGPRWESRGAED